jgi:hypothetical protein
MLLNGLKVRQHMVLFSKGLRHPDGSGKLPAESWVDGQIKRLKLRNSITQKAGS